MARIRTIKPEFWTDERIVELDHWIRLLFIGLWNFADDEGRMVCSEKRIKMQIFPADSVNVRGGLDELACAGLIELYVIEDVEYLHIPSFLKHQRVDHPSKSKVPPKPKNKAPDSPSVRGGLAPEGKGMEGKGKETTPATSTGTTEPAQPAAGVVPQELRQTLDQLRVTAAQGTDLHARAGELFEALAANSVRCNPAHPQIVEWARQGVTVAEIRKAIARARQSNGGQLNPAYLAQVMATTKSEGAGNGKASAWATDERACEAKARELGLWPARAGEDWNGLRGRIRAEIARRAGDSVA